MNRRGFVSRVALGGAAAACAGFGRPAFAAAAAGQLNVRFIGMMTFVERSDRSFLVATPGDDHHHMTHVPFLMARADSPLAKTLGMVPAEGVVPSAFDSMLEGSRPSDFVYLALSNTSLEIVSGPSDAVRNDATEMAQLQDIAPGKRLRGNLEKWASSTISLRGGHLENSAAHPDAGKVWSFGNYRQRLTDAVSFRNAPGMSTTLRLTTGADVRNVAISQDSPTEFWIISSADPGDRMNSPTKLVHSELLFDYLVDAQPVIAECAEATGREVPPTLLPFVKPTSASLGIVASEAMMPPLTDFCFVAAMLFGRPGKD